jgi:hypothetical protein
MFAGTMSKVCGTHKRQCGYPRIDPDNSVLSGRYGVLRISLLLRKSDSAADQYRHSDLQRPLRSDEQVVPVADRVPPIVKPIP